MTAVTAGLVKLPALRFPTTMDIAKPKAMSELG